jgi:alpha-L-rhamnosidase
MTTAPRRRIRQRAAACLALLALLGAIAVPGSASPDPHSMDHAVAVVGLEADAAAEPLGIDNPSPRLSWRLDASRRGVLQTRSQVVVATDPALLPAQADVWDSGIVDGADPWVDYTGPALTSHTRYVWAARVWDERGEATPWSSPTSFETAFMDPAEWSADWIGAPGPACASASRPGSCPAPLLRTEFEVDRPVATARLHASGLGYGVYHLNGQRIGDAVLDPGFTDYMVSTVYVSHDVTDVVRPGTNALGAVLGRGYFGMMGSSVAGYGRSNPWHAEPRLKLELHLTYDDGSREVITSGDGWRTTDGPIRFDDLMLGETYDARRAAVVDGWTTPGYDDGSWGQAIVVAAPAGPLRAQAQEPIRPQERLAFRSISEPQPGTYVFDLGVNIAGNAILQSDALAPGQQLVLRYGEKLTAAGRVDAGGLQVDHYTAAGGGSERWRPEFTYKGFQYVEVSGLTSPPPLDLLTAEVWHSDIAPAGSWESSHDLANRIVEVAARSILANRFSVPTDTPIYEKGAYTGDGHIMVPADSYLFDVQRFHSKWSDDIADSVYPNGQMDWIAPAPNDPSTSPHNNVHLLTPGWDAALFTTPDAVWRHYGDERPAVRALPVMRTYRDWIAGFSPGFTVTGAGGFPGIFVPGGLGDWAAPTGSQPGASIDSTAWYHEMMRVLAAVAEEAGDADTAADARLRMLGIQTAFNTRFHDPVTGAFQDTPAQNHNPALGFSQHANAMAVGLDVAWPELVQSTGDALAVDVAARGDHLSTGIMGTRFLFDALTRTGHVDEAWAAVTQTTYPSYGWWLDGLGWTGLGEYWEEGSRSRNHHMYGTVVQWLFEDVAGFEPAAPGFAEIDIRPEIPSRDLDRVRASTETVRGEVEVAWQRTADGLVLDVTVPANATATVHVPADSPADVVEETAGRAQPAHLAEAVDLLGAQDGRVTYRVGSGRYRFVTAAPTA